jgi:hypothetical protein
LVMLVKDAGLSTLNAGGIRLDENHTVNPVGMGSTKLLQ